MHLRLTHRVLQPLFLYEMVAHFPMRTYGVNQAFRFVEGIWLHRKSRQIRKKIGKDFTSYVHNMF